MSEYRDHGLSGEEQRLADLLKRTVPEPPRQLTYEEITVQRAGLLRKSWLVPAMAAAAILVIGGSIGAVAATRSGPSAPARPPVSGQSSPAPVPSPTGPTTPTCPPTPIPSTSPIPVAPTATAVPVPATTAPRAVPATTAARAVPATTAATPGATPTPTAAAATPSAAPTPTVAVPGTTPTPVPTVCATPAPVASPSATPVPRTPGGAPATAVPVPSSTTDQKVVVANVVGQAQARAEQILENIGLNVVIVREAASGGQHPPAGTVLSQSPAAGSVVRQGTTVTLHVQAA